MGDGRGVGGVKRRDTEWVLRKDAMWKECCGRTCYDRNCLVGVLWKYVTRHDMAACKGVLRKDLCGRNDVETRGRSERCDTLGVSRSVVERCEAVGVL